MIRLALFLAFFCLVPAFAFAGTDLDNTICITVNDTLGLITSVCAAIALIWSKFQQKTINKITGIIHAIKPGTVTPPAKTTDV